MPIRVPLAVNYSSPIVFLPGVWDKRDPLEGVGYCPFEIDWRTMGGPNNAVSINLQNNVQSPNSMTQITALTCDNSNCGSDVVFIFPDTQETITVPAFSPNLTVPVFTRAIFLFVVAAGAEASDVTRFLLHNVMPPPVAVPGGVEEENAAFNNIPNDGATSHTLVAATVSGTVEGLQVYFSGSAHLSITIAYKIVDGTGKIIGAGLVSVIGGDTYLVNEIVLSLFPIAVRFTNGLTFEQSGGVGEGGGWSVNLVYKTP